MIAGSSPLARGLHAPPAGPQAPGRIIPARAGFTRRPTWRPGPPPDHPRSRGVYLLLGVLGAVAEGSSPLARGLQPVLLPREFGRRIIPARAGFTPSWTARRGRGGDHPRSRGVYAGDRVHMDDRRGSSPLARGLPKKPKRCAITLRIIPARAGFTSGGGARSARRRDHPRSRGVYGPLQQRFGLESGSSQLARGLRFRAGSHSATLGIIPARAGFTRCAGHTCRVIPDHPRSRGVYTRASSGERTSTGSSPLARGLPRERQAPVAGLRIIPARAGFTFLPVRGGANGRDHPRSRGVYSGGGR